MINEEFHVDDMGDAYTETRETAPVPPYYADSTFGVGSWPG